MKIFALPIAFLVLALAGCGGTVIDATKVEEQIESSLKKEQGLAVTSADCPTDVEVTAGATFACTVTLAGGETRTATLKIRNEDADLDLLQLSANK